MTDIYAVHKQFSNLLLVIFSALWEAVPAITGIRYGMIGKRLSCNKIRQPGDTIMVNEKIPILA